jgi:NitT/TauT family transport system substrate-binding protein
MERRGFLTGAAATALATSLSGRLNAQGAAPEKTKVALGVGGKSLLYYLPLTIAERRGFFKEEGLEVEINDFGGGAKSLQALIGGSVDIVTGAYDHTIRMQAKGQGICAVVELGRFAGVTIGVRKDLQNSIKSAGDFRGLKVGVTAPGSSTALTTQFAMIKAGLKASDAVMIGVGGGASAVASIIQRQVEVISHLDPVISKLEQDDAIKVLIDTRTEAGTKALYGASNPGAVAYLRRSFIDANPNTTQRLVNAHMKALRWLAKATPEDVANVVPQEYFLGDRPLYLRAVKSSLESYSRTGIVPSEGRVSTLEVLQLLGPDMKEATIDLAATFDDRFVNRFST